MATSGITAFNPAYSDLVLESYERIQIRAAALTADHMLSATMSVRLMGAAWGVRGVNLWTVDLQVIPLSQGVSVNTLPAGTVQMLETYLRTYPMAAPVSLAPAFTTTNGSAIVAVAQANHGLSVGSWVNIVIPVAVGGLILYGFYQVASVPSTGSYTIVAVSAATSSASPGAVPQFVSTNGSTTITVNLTNHGYVAGGTFPVQVATTVGGVVLSGNYTILTASTNSFTFAAPYPATANATVSENGGLASIAGQQIGADPIDRVLTPMSRQDYAALPDKFQQGPPTNYYYDRQSFNQTATIWPVPDRNGPYALMFYRARQIQDANILATETADIPMRFLEAFCSELAARLAVKWRPAAAKDLATAAIAEWQIASDDDTERVPLRLRPDMGGYFR